MILGLSTISDENLAKLRTDPPLIWKVIAPDDPEMYESARAEASKASAGSIFARWFGKAPRETPPAATLTLGDDEVEHTDLDKAWHGIHYLLTNTAWEGEAPLNFLLRGGSEIGTIDVGYGPARGMTAKEVRAVAAALRGIDEAFLRSRFNPTEMKRLDIYPNIWDRDPAVDDTFGYCAEYFAALREFVIRASERETGLVISLS